MTQPIDFTGKTILVCGIHKGGMGGATCRQIAKGGGSVVALDKEQAYVDAIAEEVRALGGTIHTIVADLMDVAQCERVIPTALEKAGPIAGVANIAGGTRAEECSTFAVTPQRNGFAPDSQAPLSTSAR